jgi:hypothetical protein
VSLWLDNKEETTGTQATLTDVQTFGGDPQVVDKVWRPRRDLNPCLRRERTTTTRKYNDLQEAGSHLSPC